MRLSNYIMLMFAITVMFYFLGYPTLLVNFLLPNQGGFLDLSTLLRSLFDSITTPSGLAALGISVAAAAVLTFLSGFGAIYIIPLFILIAIANFFLFPISFLLSQSLPAPAELVLQVFFNVIQILAVIDFIRGGS